MLTLTEEKKISSLFTMKPVIEFKEDIKVAKINRINTDVYMYQELEKIFDSLKQFLYELPVGRYKQIVIGKKGYLKYPKLENPIKNEFLRKMEKFINNTWNIRERNSYLLYEPHIDEDIFYGNASKIGSGVLKSDTKIIEKSSLKELKKDIGTLFYGDENYPFGKPLYKWKYGFKVGDKYAIGLVNYNVSEDIVMFSTDFLNKINDDFISILHFETMDALTVENTINSAISTAKRTGMPREIIDELEKLRRQNLQKPVPLVKWSYVLYIFADNEQEAIKKAYQIKSLAPFDLTFEGDIEFEAIFSLTDFDFLKGKDMTGIVRKSTIDYLTTMFYMTGRYNGKSDVKYFIPALNEALEPAYIPIDLSLFNIAVQGQMGSGKSVSIQYMATMFDSTVFIEKIQSDVGSYAIFCNYFDGEYVPISLEVPVSINPLGQAYQYFTVNVYELAKDLGMSEPHKQLDKNEVEAISMLLDDYYFKNPKGYLTKQELLDILKNEERAIRFVEYLVKPLDENFKWKVKVTVNSAKKTFINTFLAFVYKGEDEEIPDFSEIKSFIEKVVDEFYKERYKENPQQEIFLSMLYKYIEENTPNNHIKERLLLRLYSFKEGGKYGHLFDKPTNVRKDVDHIFFEVRFSEKDIVPIIIMTIIDYVNNVLGSVKYKNKSKLTVIDEGWFFMTIPMARDFIDEAFRTYRKRGIGIAFATQKPEDFEGMQNYFPYVWILYLEDSESAVKTYKLTDRDGELIGSIDKPKAYGYKYSKFFLIFKNSLGKTEKGLFILPSYPEFRWIAETDPVFKLQREEAVRKTGSLRKAIEYLSFEKK